MLVPELRTRTEKRHPFICQRIAGTSLRAFIFVATTTCQPQVRLDGQAAATLGMNVFKAHSLPRQFFRAQAVAAAILCLHPNAAAQTGRDVLFSHLDRTSRRNSTRVGSRCPRKRNNTAARALRSMIRSASCCNTAKSVRSGWVSLPVLLLRSRRLSRC